MAAKADRAADDASRQSVFETGMRTDVLVHKYRERVLGASQFGCLAPQGPPDRVDPGRGIVNGTQAMIQLRLLEVSVHV